MATTSSRTTEHDRSWYRSFRQRLLRWYRSHRRELPWRDTHDPYAIWVSEIMLQQTQVATVLGYYQRFLERFPDVQALAAAPEAEVLRYWEGLGYYRRARQMHVAAGVMMEQHAGLFPIAYNDVLALPGIGRYTAGAILSFAHDRKLPIVEANTQRLYCRLLAHREDPASTASLRRLWQFAEELLPARNAGELNQALIELGATICLPRGPKCSQCPARSLCPTYAGNLQKEIPAAKTKMVYEDRHEAAIVVYQARKILLRRCAEGQRWAGLWDFPRFVVGPDAPQADLRNHLSARLTESFQIEAVVQERLIRIRHGVTRYRITLDCFAAQWQRGKPGGDQPAEHVWCRVEELADYPLSVTGRKISRLLL